LFSMNENGTLASRWRGQSQRRTFPAALESHRSSECFQMSVPVCGNASRLHMQPLSFSLLVKSPSATATLFEAQAHVVHPLAAKRTYMHIMQIDSSVATGREQRTRLLNAPDSAVRVLFEMCLVESRWIVELDVIVAGSALQTKALGLHVQHHNIATRCQAAALLPIDCDTYQPVTGLC
jgi:hypothetical protein